MCLNPPWEFKRIVIFIFSGCGFKAKETSSCSCVKQILKVKQKIWLLMSWMNHEKPGIVLGQLTRDPVQAFFKLFSDQNVFAPAPCFLTKQNWAAKEQITRMFTLAWPLPQNESIISRFRSGRSFLSTYGSPLIVNWMTWWVKWLINQFCLLSDSNGQKSVKIIRRLKLSHVTWRVIGRPVQSQSLVK